MAEGLRTLRRKRRIVGKIRQITRAMKLVSAAKLKRATARWEQASYYCAQLDGACARAAEAAGQRLLPLAELPGPGASALLVIAGDKGLCGAYNASVVARAAQFAAQREAVSVFTVGGRTAELARQARLRVVRELPGLVDRLQGRDASELAAELLARYRSGEVARVDVCYARFVSRLVYQPTVVTLLPMFAAPAETVAADAGDALFEPAPPRLVEDLLPVRLRAQVLRLLLEAAAAEHSARLLAMSAATENAEEMLEILTRQINRARQAQITSELLDVVAGADALTSQA